MTVQLKVLNKILKFHPTKGAGRREKSSVFSLDLKLEVAADLQDSGTLKAVSSCLVLTLETCARRPGGSGWLITKQKVTDIFRS